MTRVTREIEGLALLVMYQLYAQQTGGNKPRNDDLLIPLCCRNLIRAFSLNTKELSYSPTITELEFM